MTTISNQLSGLDWKLIAKWIAATILGWIIGFFFCMLVEDIVYDLTHLAVDGAVIGIGIGLVQSFVLKSKTIKRRWWVLASIIGFAIGKGIGDALVVQYGGWLGNASAGAAIGLVSGITQTTVLDGHVKRAPLWILTNLLAWLGGWLIIGTITENYELQSYFIGSIGAAIVGLVSGITLAILFRAPRTD